MGCVESIDVSFTTFDKLRALVIKLKYVCGLEKSRLDMQLKKQQNFLLSDFQKPLKLRNKLVEHSMIESNLTFFSEIIIYMMVQNSCKVLQEHITYFQGQNKLQLFKHDLNLVLYCSVFLRSENLAKFSSTFRSLFPKYSFPSDNDITDVFVKEFKLNRKVSFQRQKEYVFQFCNNYQISTEKINQIGHNYKYAAIKYQ